MTRRGGTSLVRRTLPLLLVAAVAAGCTVRTEPTTPQERASRVEADMQALFANAPAIEEPLTLYAAQAYALNNSLERRLKLLDEAVALKLAGVSGYDMLPKVVTSAGYMVRNNDWLLTGSSPSTGGTSNPVLFSDRSHDVEGLAVAWNVLDFGVSYLRARQQADLMLVAKERRRKVVQNLLNDVRAAYWRALAEQMLTVQLEPLAARVQAAWAAEQANPSAKAGEPAALERQKVLLDLLAQVQLMRRALAAGRLELAMLMNVELRRPITLAMPAGFNSQVRLLPIDPPALERAALLNRPELREEDYQTRISADETKKAMVRLLPGLDFGLTLNRDSNSYLVNHNWAEAGLRLSWNLISLMAGPNTIDIASTQERIGHLRRLSTSMAVIAQVNVAIRRFQLATADYEVAAPLAAVEDQLFDQALRAPALPEAELLRRATLRLWARYRRDLAYVEVQAAAGALSLSLGGDPVPENATWSDLDGLRRAIEAGAAEGAVMQPPTFAPPAPPQPTAQAAPADPSSPAGPKVLSPPAGMFAADPQVSRFVAFLSLVEAGQASQDEYLSRRAANLGALLPYSSGRPWPAAGTAAAQAQPVAALLRQAEASPERRAVILDGLLPLSPAADPAGPPAPAAARGRAVSLAAAGLIDNDELSREVQAVDAALAAAAKPAQPARVSPAVANRPWVKR